MTISTMARLALALALAASLSACGDDTSSTNTSVSDASTADTPSAQTTFRCGTMTCDARTQFCDVALTPMWQPISNSERCSPLPANNCSTCDCIQAFVRYTSCESIGTSPPTYRLGIVRSP